MNRETIYATLFDRLKTIPGIRTASRRLRHWSDVDQSEQPALFMTQGNEHAAPGDQIKGTPTKWTFAVDLYLYARTSDTSESPSSALNPLLDAVEAALKPDNTMQRKQTLGGLVEHCWIEGSIETDEGALGDQAVAVIPIRILAA